MLISRSWWVVGLVATVIGCRSVAPDDEVRLSSEVVGRRAGVIPAWLDEPPPVEIPATLTLREATRLALIHHPVLRTEIARVTEARADFAQAHLLPNPVIAVDYGFPFDGGGGNPLISSLVEQLAALWTRPAKIASADAALRRRVLQLSDAALRLVADVRMAFSDVVHGERLRDLAEQRVALLVTRRSLVARQHDVGDANRRAVNLARMEEAWAQDQALRTGEGLDLALRRLAELLSVPAAVLDDIELQRDDSRTFDRWLAVDERRCIELAATQRLDVVAAFTAVGVAKASSRLASLARLPEVDIGMQLERNFQNRKALTPLIRVVPDIFDTGRVAQAKAEAIEARTRSEAERLLLAAVYETRVAYVKFETLRSRREALEQTASAAARENAEFSRRAFEIGESSRTQWLVDQARVLDLERETEELLMSICNAYYELERVVGGSFDVAPLPEALARQEGER